MKSDIEYMKIALELSKKGNPSPNPYVGAVLVKNGEIISTGFHEKAGLPHAEVNALKNVDATDATLYVTLEPCTHHGRTPPCTDAIIKAGVKKVVYACDDPTEKVNGVETLKNAGVEVVSRVYESECEKQNEVFMKYTKTKLPYVVLKAAITLDGQIAAASGDSFWISNETSREYVHRLRSQYDAIIVGANTVEKDNPRLTSRVDGGRNPLKVVIDGRCIISEDAKIFADGKVVVATTKIAQAIKIKKLSEKAKVLILGDDKVKIDFLLYELGKMGVSSILIEGGSDIYTQFIEYTDKFHFFIAPKIMGGVNKPVFSGKTIDSINESKEIVYDTIENLDGDIHITAYPMNNHTLKGFGVIPIEQQRG